MTQKQANDAKSQLIALDLPVILGLTDTSRTAQTPTMSRFTQANGLREPVTNQTTTVLAGYGALEHNQIT
jgi:hypothetical protein